MRAFHQLYIELMTEKADDKYLFTEIISMIYS